MEISLFQCKSSSTAKIWGTIFISKTERYTFWGGVLKGGMNRHRVRDGLQLSKLIQEKTSKGYEHICDLQLPNPARAASVDQTINTIQTALWKVPMANRIAQELEIRRALNLDAPAKTPPEPLSTPREPSIKLPEVVVEWSW
ncbi:hypothetical protein BAE30_00050 [Acidithiobacillus caldus]|uniref:Uncharacterized protein n=1 Tax=Acidithiobacillus caldus TaxID=33059 RepID=A0A1E7Z4Z5_9PROT|nr:hypothetical protein BAE30_00050 [Acidithiobacillus caldus]